MTNVTSDAQTPNVTLIQLARGFMLAKALQAAAELGIADLLDEAPQSCEELARATGTHAPSLYRLLRALAGEGIFQEKGQGRFVNTLLSAPLRANAPDSVRDNVLYIPHEGNMLAWTRFMDTLKTGTPSFADANGLPAWEYLLEHPELEACFDRSMTRLTAFQCQSIVAHCDFSACKSLVDIGGGQGLLLAEILQAHPQLRGVLFERRSVAVRAKKYLADKGLAQRCEVVVGDFRENIPHGHDAYMMKQIPQVYHSKPPAIK